MSDLDRRDFLKTGAVASAAVLGGALVPRAAQAQPPSPVYVAGGPATYSTDAQVKTSAIRDAVEAAVRELARERSGSAPAGLGEAWEIVLGTVSAATTVAIHVTCFYADLANRNSPQLDTLAAIVEGLAAMRGGTYARSNVRVFDNDMSGVHRLHAVYGESAITALGVVHQLNTFSAAAAQTANGQTLYPHTYLADADHVISLARLSGHQFSPGSGPGITGCVKGMMGAVSCSTGSFGGIDAVFHNDLPTWQGHVDYWTYLRPRFRLAVLDMIKASYDERHAPVVDVGEICLGPDPCAVDGYGAWRLAQLEQSDPRFCYYGLSIPNAVAAVDAAWNTVYAKRSCALPATGTTRTELDAAIRDHRAGTATEAEVKALIESYREP